jgi:arginine decarboxylase
MVKNLETWTVAKSEELYGVREWGKDYFSIDAQGRISVNLTRDGQTLPVALYELVEGLKERGMRLPVLLRFPHLLEARLALINNAFRKAIRESEYRGDYRGVYPIKVNQQQQVVEDIAQAGRRYHHGLEAGSKAELIAALAYMHDPEAFIVCNGYKDAEFVDLALYALKMGLQTLLVIEMPGELDVILDRAQALGVRPRIGVRVKLSSRSGGKWTDSGGDRSMFGLNPAQVIDVIDTLRRRESLDCLHLLHYHLGSQIPNIAHIRNGIAEAARYYVELVKEGAPMGLLDIGGGLAVDYDGSHTNFASSSNYNLDEYCADIVEGIMQVADSADVPHPVIISESGRALIAYYSVLLFDILDVSRFESHGVPASLPEDAPTALHNLMEALSSLTEKKALECFHDAMFYRDEIRNGFAHGDVSLRHRAVAEQMVWHILMRLSRMAEKMKYVPEELQNLADMLADIYYGNFSVFQSLPDAWAIEQLFPIMPIHRLNEAPDRLGTLADITCDCDGKIERFIDLHDVKRVLPLHSLREGEDYVLGAFLVGAYQETLGDLHNLFGDTNVVSIQLDDRGRLAFSREIEGDTVEDVLGYVEYNPKAMIEQSRSLAEQAVRRERITPAERRDIVGAYANGLRGYTYFET